MAPLPASQTKSLTAQAIDAWCEAQPRDADSPTLRCSGLGEPCDRRLWYGYRWAVSAEAFPAGIRRILSNGHDRETRIVEMLRGAGLDVHDRDPETGQQWRVALASGFLTGSVDGVATGVPEAPATRHLVEIKTMNKARWEKWRREGVRRSHWKYYVQMQLYMLGLGLTRALFVSENQDSKEIEVERIDFDPAFAAGQEARAERIARTETPPQRISDDADWWGCRFCPARAPCHGLPDAEPARRNCRTCLASCVSEGGWGCARHGVDLHEAAQAEGCPVHLYLPALVPGEQIDADEEACTVTYRMPDGSTWTDGPQPQEAQS